MHSSSVLLQVVEWLSSHGIICDLDLNIMCYDERVSVKHGAHDSIECIIKLTLFPVALCPRDDSSSD